MLVHGGMAQNVGPILEMVTEKYLLRSRARVDRAARKRIGILDDILAALHAGDVRAHRRGHHRATSVGPIQTIIPWASNLYTETLIAQVRAEFGADFWGFWMLGGMSGGGMGFIFAPARKADGAGSACRPSCRDTKRELEHALPFAMEPVVYDFAINERGTWADLLAGADGAACRPGYYTLHRARAAAQRPPQLSPRRAAPNWTASAPPAARGPSCAAWCRRSSTACCRAPSASAGGSEALAALLAEHGFDRAQHEQIRADLRGGRIGLAQNRLPVEQPTSRTCAPDDVVDADRTLAATRLARARAGRAGGRRGRRGHAWPPARAAAGRRARAWSRRCTPSASSAAATAPSSRSTWPRAAASAALPARPLPHIFTTSYLTHDADRATSCSRADNYGYAGPLLPLARAQSIGLRTGPDGARPALRLGGDAAAAARRAAAEGPRQPARRADRLGATAPARAATTPTTCRCSACTRSATGTKCPNLLRTACWRACWPSAPSCNTCCCTTSTRSAPTSTRRCSGWLMQAGAALHLRGHHPPPRGPRRRPGPRQRPAAPGRRPGHAARGGRVRACPTTTRTPAGSTSTACWPSSSYTPTCEPEHILPFSFFLPTMATIFVVPMSIAATYCSFLLIV